MKKLFLFLILISQIIACKKDDDTAYKVDFNITLNGQYYEEPDTLDIDVDGDGISDVRLSSETWGSPGVGTHPRSTIASLHSGCLLLGFHENDTIYKRVYTNITHQDTVTTISISTYYSCYRVTETDSVSDIRYNQFEITPLSSTDELNMSGDFRSDTVILVDEGWSYSLPFTTGYGTDTIIKTYFSYSGECGYFPQNEIKYIGVKLNNNGTDRLGWIKLSILDKKIITILEAGLLE